MHVTVHVEVAEADDKRRIHDQAEINLRVRFVGPALHHLVEHDQDDEQPLDFRYCARKAA
jgi:hypothetical protein